jgi:FAD/FMN-containing dehydrogenase
MPIIMTSTRSLPEQLAGIVGAPYVLTDPAEIEPFVNDWRGRYRGVANCVVCPANTAQVAAVVKACLASRTPMVPQGGNTGHCGAATPDSSGTAVLLNLSRLNRIIAVDAKNSTISVDAGCTLAAVQEAARAEGRLFPLSLAAEGSCQIGGNLSTNAGGVQVLRYGNTRDLTLGLEVVLPSGEIWDGMRHLRKDNTGYDLKQLFIGAEGTLGIITAAVLKLYPVPKTQTTCWLSVATASLAVDLLNVAKSRFDAQLTAFELISEASLALVLRHIPGARRPTQTTPWYVLAEFSDSLPNEVENWLGEMLADAVLIDATLARSESQAHALWALREQISEAQKRDGVSIKHDVSLPVSSVAEFLSVADAALQKAYPGIRVIAFGHLGDGNLHFNLSQADTRDNAAFIASQTAVNRLVHDMVDALNGSISAEHGIGQLKRDELRRYKSPLELAMMRSIKNAFDPLGLMNPGKIL